MAVAAKKVKRIKGLRVLEGSLVDRGACPAAEILLWKGAGGQDARLTSALAEIAAIQREEPVSDHERLIREVVEDFRQDFRAAVPERQEQEQEIKMQMSETTRMLKYAAAGGTVHSWSDADVYEAITERAQELHPGVPLHEALSKSWGHPDISRLYGLYKSAERAPVEEPVEKAVDSAAWRKIKQAVAAFRATPEGQHLSEPAALTAVVEANPKLYEAYRNETYGRDLND